MDLSAHSGNTDLRYWPGGCRRLLAVAEDEALAPRFARRHSGETRPCRAKPRTGVQWSPSASSPAPGGPRPGGGLSSGMGERPTRFMDKSRDAGIQNGKFRSSNATYRCREKKCAKRFSLKTGTVREVSRLRFQIWMIATYLMGTNPKSVSSMKLHHDLHINQRSGWFLAHRLRVALSEERGVSSGPVEAAESYFGGRRRNMSNARRKELADTGRGAVGKTTVVGVNDRATKQVAARLVERTDGATLQGFVIDHTASGATIYSGDSRAYKSLQYDHDSVKHSLSKVRQGRRAHEQHRIPRCSSGGERARATRCLRSIPTGTCRSSRVATTSPTKTPSTSWAPRPPARTASDSGTPNLSPRMGCRVERGILPNEQLMS